MLSINLYILTTEIMPGTPRTANMVQFFKFSALYIEKRLTKVARFLSLVFKMVKSKDLKFWKCSADFCSLHHLIKSIMVVTFKYL